MVSFLKPAEHSRQTLTMFWGVQILNFLTISTHWFLTTSSLEFYSILKLYIFSASLPILLLHFSKNLLQITLLIVIILCYFAYIPLLPSFKFIYYICIILILIINYKSIFQFSIHHFHKYHYAIGLLILTYNICTNWFSNFNYLQLLYSGWIHDDTLFLSSLCAMYKTYNVISLGIDGLIPTVYHSFALKVYAGISIVSGLSVIQVMSMFHPVTAATVIFLSIGYTIKSFHDKFNSKIFIQYLLLYFITYQFFIFRTVNTTYDFFWSQSMFIGTFLFLMIIILMNEYTKSRQNKNLLIVLIYSIILTQTKSNIAFFNIALVSLYVLMNFKNNKFIIIYYLIFLLINAIFLDQIISVNLSRTNPSFTFADSIIKYESLMPRFNIHDRLIRIIFYSIVFYSPYLTYLIILKRTNQKLITNNILNIIIHLTCFVSVLFNYFFTIGFEMFYFIGPSLFFSIIGITSITSVNSKIFNFLPIILVLVCTYSILDMWRMGNKANRQNYIYNKLVFDNNEVSQKLIQKLITIKPSRNNIIKYNIKDIPINNFPEHQIKFLIPTITECVTVGQKIPKGVFWGGDPYKNPNDRKLPKSPKIINISD